MAKFLEKHGDILQNIEFAIADTFRHRPALCDYDVMHVLEAVADAYTGERIGRPPRKFNLTELEAELRDEVRAMCEWRLGRGDFPSDREHDGPQPDPVAVDDIIWCLKHIGKSVKFWNKEGGRQGYLTFVTPYLP